MGQGRWDGDDGTGKMGRGRWDGDDGTGSDADFVEIDFSSASLPGWWEIEILDQSGLTTSLDRTQATAANESWSWDGRDIDGFIAPPGDYLLVVTALDDSWNHGASCELDVAIEQVFTSPY